LVPPLPVELMDFSVKNVDDNILLNWSTATEINNYGFDIERRTAESDWRKIGFVEGNGNSNVPKNYLYYDNTAINDVYFYRLKQIDFDGIFEYSNVIQIQGPSINEFRLFQNYPNPFNPVTNIKFQLAKDDNVRLDVYNEIGQRVATLLDKYTKAGSYTVKFDAGNLPSGVYLYRIQSGNYSATNKLIYLK
jgi:hypothetical protein